MRLSFDVNDRKGLEIIILTALLTFQDASETYHTPPAEQPATPGGTSINPLARMLSAGRISSDVPPPPPPKPAPKSGLERIIEMHGLRGDAFNEVTVEEEGSFTDWAAFCDRLLQVGP
jgi:hypothetical protein